MGYFDGCSFSEFADAFRDCDAGGALNSLFGFVSRHRAAVLQALREAQRDMAEYETRARFLARKAGVSLSRLERAG